jgi:hypothetical protein
MTIGSTMPMAVNKRNAASRPFHVFDCYIRNHSPHTNKKATGHNVRQAAKRCDGNILRTMKVRRASSSACNIR